MVNHYGFFDEASKREVRRASLKAISIPGYQVPFGSREMPIARGWGTGGLQLTLCLLGPGDVIKVIDQGADDSVNAMSIKKLLVRCAPDIELTEETDKADLIQSRHRIPEVSLTEDQILILQVPIPEPLRFVEPLEHKTKQMHAEQDYSGAYLVLFEEIVRHGRMTTGADHPVKVAQRYIMAPSPIPKFDNPKMNNNPGLILLGAGREKKIYAVPPYTMVASLDFEDVPFKPEIFPGESCRFCGATDTFLDELQDPSTFQTVYQCNDTSFCHSRRLK
jgi:alpha-D-ribose 1-methylphosphonate 5-phosphate C-P lyase